ncbi:MAG: 50S ribosomal protein L21 [Bacteroidales bacterium]|nr:50S ribosomal protein L21 [Bacteroidales bacterium]MBN2763311.1 50S ribosomal protein L21 [Bacteroidales bacterium]
MYAIVTIAGQQFKVEKGKKVIVHQLQSDVGNEVTFEKVLLIDNNGKISIGTPYLKDAAVTAQVISHLRGDKIKVFKKKRRKGYQVLNGHRQCFTEILIEEIIEKGFVKKAAKIEKEEKPVAEEKAKTQPAVAADEKPEKPAAKKTTVKKAKPVVKKADDEKTKPAVKKAVKKETKPKAKDAAAKTGAKPKPAVKKEDKTKKA